MLDYLQRKLHQIYYQKLFNFGLILDPLLKSLTSYRSFIFREYNNSMFCQIRNILVDLYEILYNIFLNFDTSSDNFKW